MTVSQTSAFVEAAFLSACRAELKAIKPGNVHLHAPGHGMDVATFERAALAAAPFIADPGLTVGARILKATQAGFSAAGCNANLGILLLAAPIARAFEDIAAVGRAKPSPEALKASLDDVLNRLDASDASEVFAAIAHASPGGLGAGGEHDVRNAPTIGLMDAMRLSAGKDRIARQYACGFCDLFETGLTAVNHASRAVLDHKKLGPAFAIYLAFTARFADTHIARKFGSPVSEKVRERFAVLSQAVEAEQEPDVIADAALHLDADLKAEGVNPGTSADLTVATIFVIELCQPAFFTAPLRKRVSDD